jgi:UDP-glucose 6-dehydrogenase
VENSFIRWMIAGKGSYAEETARFLASLKSVCFQGYTEQNEKQYNPSFLLYTGSLPFENSQHEALEELHYFINHWMQKLKESPATDTTLLLTRPLVPGTAEHIAKILRGNNKSVSVAAFPLLGIKGAIGESSIWRPPAFIIGSSKDGRGVKELRRLLGSSGYPVMLMPPREAEMLHYLYITECINKTRILELASSPDLSDYDWVTIMRGFGLHAEIGQQSICADDIPTEWICRVVQQHIAINKQRKPTVAVWHSSAAHITRITSILKQMDVQVRVYCTELKPENKNERIFLEKWETICGAEALIILEPHKEFSNLMLSEWDNQLKGEKIPPLIIDCCGLYEPEEMNAIGCHYISYGREIFKTF